MSELTAEAEVLEESEESQPQPPSSGDGLLLFQRVVAGFYALLVGMSLWVAVLAVVEPGRWGGGTGSTVVLWSLLPGFLVMAVPLALSHLKSAWPVRARWWLAGLSLGLPIVAIGVLLGLQ